MVDIEGKLQSQVMRLAGASKSLEGTLTDFVLSHLRAKETHHPFVRVFMAQLFVGGDAFSRRIVDLQAAVDPPLYTLFGRLRERGLIRSDIPLPELIQSFKVLQLGVTSLWAVEGPPWKQSRALARRQVRFFCEGIRGEKHA